MATIIKEDFSHRNEYLIQLTKGSSISAAQAIDNKH